MFVIYSDTGAILGTISGPDASYGDILNKEKRQWLFLEGTTSLDPHVNHVDVSAKAIVPHHSMNLTASLATIKVGVDSTIISGIPERAAVILKHNGEQFAGEVVSGGHVELTAAYSGTYRVEVSCQNHIPAAIEIVAQ